MADRIPHSLVLHGLSRVLELSYADGTVHRLPCEYLRVYSPSAEVRGHSPAQAVLQTGKRAVSIVRIEPVGHYALRLVFDDGHDSGLYTWAYLHELCVSQAERWASYLEALAAAGADRD